MSKAWPMVALLGGILLALNGIVYTIGLVPSFGRSSSPILVDLIGMVGLGLMPLGLGLAGIWYGRRRLQQIAQTTATQRDSRIEQSILRAAQSHPTGVTLEDVVRQTSFDTNEVKAALEKMYLDSKLEMDVTEQGHLVYKPRAVS
jgi:hypothetical protein